MGVSAHKFFYTFNRLILNAVLFLILIFANGILKMCFCYLKFECVKHATSHSLHCMNFIVWLFWTRKSSSSFITCWGPFSGVILFIVCLNVAKIRFFFLLMENYVVYFAMNKKLKRYTLCLFGLGFESEHTAKSCSSICLFVILSKWLKKGKSVHTACDLHCNRIDAGRTEHEKKK